MEPARGSSQWSARLHRPIGELGSPGISFAGHDRPRFGGPTSWDTY
ncbi:hypothetical protein OG279_07920 [Streptomyces sp. NBC_01201]|nr:MULTISPECIES: hypothetical protein [unclassified Streptomyces]WSQ84207.1 hypothetical protein OG722_07590 [Streptomyces sp. NBC_01212]WSR47538.1 hypothetical protein OG279_07920 [Streptomyces sp. NBC_01201]